MSSLFMKHNVLYVKTLYMIYYFVSVFDFVYWDPDLGMTSQPESANTEVVTLAPKSRDAVDMLTVCCNTMWRQSVYYVRRFQGHT